MRSIATDGLVRQLTTHPHVHLKVHMGYRNIHDNRPSLGTKGRKLTPKMLSFINAYFGEANFNATKAMELSDYKCTTPGSVPQTAAELMNHPLVVEEITRRMDARS